MSDDETVTIPKQIWDVFTKTKIENLNFHGMGLTDDCLPFFINVIKQFKRNDNSEEFKYIYLHDNKLTDAGILKLLTECEDVIQKQKLLISACNNPISDVGCIAIAKINSKQPLFFFNIFPGTLLTDDGLCKVTAIFDAACVGLKKDYVIYANVDISKKIIRKGIIRASSRLHNHIIFNLKYYWPSFAKRYLNFSPDYLDRCAIRRRARARVIAYELFPQLYLKKFL